MEEENKEKVDAEVVGEGVVEGSENLGDGKEKCGLNFMKLLNDPLVGELMKSGKDMFKKEKADPNVCEITIKAPSEVVLKLFNISE